MKSWQEWHALSPSEGRDLAVRHALRSSGRATQIKQLILLQALRSCHVVDHQHLVEEGASDLAKLLVGRMGQIGISGRLVAEGQKEAVGEALGLVLGTVVGAPLEVEDFGIFVGSCRKASSTVLICSGVVPSLNLNRTTCRSLPGLGFLAAAESLPITAAAIAQPATTTIALQRTNRVIMCS